MVIRARDAVVQQTHRDKEGPGRVTIRAKTEEKKSQRDLVK